MQRLDAMQIKQEPSFKPVVITLATREEAEDFWGILLAKEPALGSGPKALAIKLSNWFTEHYR